MLLSTPIVFIQHYQLKSHTETFIFLIKNCKELNPWREINDNSKRSTEFFLLLLRFLGIIFFLFSAYYIGKESLNILIFILLMIINLHQAQMQPETNLNLYFLSVIAISSFQILPGKYFKDSVT